VDTLWPRTLQVIRALDGPLVITSCVTDRSECHQLTTCTVREPLRRVNDAIVKALSDVTVSSLIDDNAGLVHVRVEGRL
jgi:DNA-binding IscR family transcriptional regulator